MGDGAVDLVFLDETADLVHLVFGGGFDGGTHITAVFSRLQHNIVTFCRKLKNPANFFSRTTYFATSFIIPLCDQSHQKEIDNETFKVLISTFLSTPITLSDFYLNF